MSSKKERARQLFSSGCNCCQAVAVALAGGEALPDDVLMRLAAGFGGGMRRKEVCGAVTAGLMALGLKYGAATPGDKAAKAEGNAKALDFMNEFEKRHGSYLCRDLQGTKCPDLVAAAVGLAEELGV